MRQNRFLNFPVKVNDCELLNRLGMILHARESHVQEFPFPHSLDLPAVFLVVGDLLRFTVFQQWNLVYKSFSRSSDIGTFIYSLLLSNCTSQSTNNA